jgi:hypothetical protein
VNLVVVTSTRSPAMISETVCSPESRLRWVSCARPAVLSLIAIVTAWPAGIVRIFSPTATGCSRRRFPAAPPAEPTITTILTAQPPDLTAQPNVDVTTPETALGERLSIRLHLTDSVRVDELAAAKFVPPEKTAWSFRAPARANRVTHAACPVERFTATALQPATVRPSSTKRTVPPSGTGVTAAVSDTRWPVTTGFAEAVNAIAVITDADGASEDTTSTRVGPLVRPAPGPPTRAGRGDGAAGL